MIILPDKNIIRTKFLLPISEKTWRTPSLAQPKDVFGQENNTRFNIKARLNDGYVVWSGWFESRDDFDVFLWSIITKKLKTQKALWNLPTPSWTPDIGVNVSYDFSTITAIVSPITTVSTYTTPLDWNNANNSVETIGGGASGGVRRQNGVRTGTGGGGGGYSKSTNLTLTTGGSNSYSIGLGGAGVSTASSVTVNGIDGGQTWFGATTYAASTVGSNAGLNGIGSTSTAATAGGAGGATGRGTTLFAGGAGGGKSATASIAFGGGGGGAGGPNGNGVAGVSNASDGSTAGGAGGNSSGGAGGSPLTGFGTASAGGDGSDIASNPVIGSGGGGGGGRANDTPGNITGGAGGSYGAGGGGAVGGGGSNSGTTASGAGKQGVIAIIYQPKALIPNIPMCF
jgi:hypothetical protein